MAEPGFAQIFPGEYQRDLVGYGGTTPTREECWPNKARVAVQFVINYEEVRPSPSLSFRFG